MTDAKNGEEAGRPTRCPQLSQGPLSYLSSSFLFFSPAVAQSLTGRSRSSSTQSRREENASDAILALLVSPRPDRSDGGAYRKKKMQCPCVHPPVHILDKKRRPLATTDIKNSYLRRFINGIILGRRSGAIWRDRVEHCSFRSVVIRSRASKTLRTRLRTPPGQNANGINRKKTDRHVALELLWIMILIRICGRGDENVHLRRADVKRQSTRPDSFVYPVQSSAGSSILNKSISSVAGVTCPTTFA